jgi:D-beta-D-heptose 7-phosphate kinase/D-beta-D-heptose 1-phosphate adenosyltransferase
MDTQQQKQFKILLIGDSCIDIYQYGYVDRISPEAPVPVFVKGKTEKKQGMANNVAYNLFALGCDVKILTGKQSVKTRFIDSRSKQQIIRIDDDVYSQPINRNGIDLSAFDAVVISDYNKGTISYEFIEDLRKDFNGPIFTDTKKTDLSKFEGCVVKINTHEANLIVSECSELIVTAGAEGAYYKGVRYPAIRAEVMDVCGAGDTFLAALTFKYLQTKNMEQAIQFAINASSVTVQHLGVYAPSLEEICD